WRLDRYELSTLRRTSSTPLPTDAAGRPAVAGAAAVDGGPALLVAGNRFTAFDPVSGAPVGVGARIDHPATTGRGDDPRFWRRPGHPGQAAVLNGGALE